MSKQVGIEGLIKFNNAGGIDHEASIGAFATALLRYEAESEESNARIADAVHAVFDAHPNMERIRKDYIVAEAVMRLNCQPEQYSLMKGRVSEFIKNSPCFETNVGKGGGTKRVSR